MKNRLVLVIVAFLMLVKPYSVEALPKSAYEYCITWRHYAAGEPREQAVYIWNGKAVGRGKKGFQAILKKLDDLPSNSTVYVFPKAAQFRYEGGGAVDPDSYYPFFDYWEDLRHVERVKSLNLIFTYKDERGNPLKGL